MPFDLVKAQQLDATDTLAQLRERFHIPPHKIYCCGNSLGLQPKATAVAIAHELNKWALHGVDGWFEGDDAWLSYHKRCQASLARVVGAMPDEVCPMNHLSVNLHLALASFYQPTASRHKILTIAHDFPSDQYVLETHLKHHKLTPENSLIEITPRPNEYTIRLDDILDTIETQADQIALVCMSGLHYYTGQLLDMQAIAQKAQQHGIVVGFDLAHAVGNVPLQLHDWGIDFAVWCSYKYLNSGPGGVGGMFVHQKHFKHTATTQRLAGWWGYDEAKRFEMTAGFVPEYGAAGWQLSTPTIVSLAAHRAALDVFDETTVEKLRAKSLQMTQFLIEKIVEINQKTGHTTIKIMTPLADHERGCQLSLLIDEGGAQFFAYLTAQNVICDWREPNCIRIAPTPLYNSFQEIYQLDRLFEEYFLK